MTCLLRPSRVLARLRRGKTAYCIRVNLADARGVELASGFGFDCVWTCCEHTPNDLGVVEKQVLAAKSRDVDLVCRVSKGSYSDYIRPLEMDATGIMVPHVMSAGEARRIVRMTRFHPVGLRPVDGGNADGRYCNVGFREYLAAANAQRFIVLQIEDREPMEDLDEIARVEGYDILFFGPGDFSQSIGCPGEWDHPKISEARKRVADAAIRAGKFAGTVGNAADCGALIEMGYTFVNVGADVVGLNRYYSDLAKTCGIDASMA